MKTAIDLLEELRQAAIHNLSCYSADLNGIIPKVGYEKEHADALRDIELASGLTVLVNVIKNDSKTAYTGFVKLGISDEPETFKFEVPDGATEEDIECLVEEALWKSGVIEMWYERGMRKC